MRDRHPWIFAIAWGVLLVTHSSHDASAQNRGIQDEALVPSYTLPDPLRSSDGTPINDPDAWTTSRRPELLRIFATQMYGVTPIGRPTSMRWETLEESEDAYDGLAIRRQVRIFFNGDPDGQTIDLLIYIPKDVPRPVPAFLALNFGGNQAINDDPAVIVTKAWVRDRPSRGTDGNRATEASRSSASSRWPVRTILERGYAVATIYYGDIEPDYDGAVTEGVRTLALESGQDQVEADQWGAIGAWAWGLSRGLDVLGDQSEVDAERVAVMGHSRLGKTALWAGAQDERFALVISNDSGCGGAALSRRTFGETVKRINTSFPHWFCRNFRNYNDREPDLPFDQHTLIALIAPRPVLVCSAEDDLWADPRGEFLSALGADPVYRLLGTAGLPVDTMPPLSTPALGQIGYHIRPGRHDVTLEDWLVYLKFADQHLSR